MHETFEHTADLGLRIRAPSLDQLFTEAAEALFCATVENLDAVKPIQRIEVHLQGDDLALLLFDWLNELLYRFDTEHLVFGKFEAEVSSAMSRSPDCDKVSGKIGSVGKPCHNLVASAWGESLDSSRHLFGHEVKAITYHGLRVENEGNGWLAEVIVDI